MRALVLIAVLINISVAQVPVTNKSCPTWFVHKSNRCECGLQFRNILECSQEHTEIKIMSSFCLTYSNNKEHFGACPYNTDTSFLSLRAVPSDVSQLDEAMCGPLNRTGLLCSQCQPGLGPAVFSYYRECKECMKWPYGWIVLFVRLIVPLTLFCVLVIVFQINIASPSLTGSVLAAQLVSSALSNNPFLVNVLGESYTITKFGVDIYGIFTLDFFVYLIPSFCIHEDMKMSTVVALDYFTALYPIILTVIVYFCISLHNKGNKVMTVCWKPFHKCFARFRQSWNPKGSVLTSFSTFLLLSHCKICLASIRLVQLIQVWDKYGNFTNGMYFEPTYEMFKDGEYVGYLVLALTVSLVVVLLPALFILFYQNKFFQRCLHFCRFRFRIIHELANIIQGCFKNGTSPGTRDYRWFAGLYLLLRILVVVIVTLRYHLLVYVTLFMVLTVMVGILRPYKSSFYNVADSVLWLVTTIGLSWSNYFEAFGIKWTGFLYLFGSFPLIWLCFCCSWKIIVYVGTRCRAYLAAKHVAIKETENIGDEIPHRVMSPHLYRPLLEHH